MEGCIDWSKEGQYHCLVQIFSCQQGIIRQLHSTRPHHGATRWNMQLSMGQDVMMTQFNQLRWCSQRWPNYLTHRFRVSCVLDMVLKYVLLTPSDRTPQSIRQSIQHTGADSQGHSMDYMPFATRTHWHYNRSSPEQGWTSSCIHVTANCQWTRLIDDDTYWLRLHQAWSEEILPIRDAITQVGWGQTIVLAHHTHGYIWLRCISKSQILCTLMYNAVQMSQCYGKVPPCAGHITAATGCTAD